MDISNNLNNSNDNISIDNNSIQINSDCEKTLAEKNVTINVKINYDVLWSIWKDCRCRKHFYTEI